MVADKARVDAVALDHVEVQRFEQAFAGGAQGKVGFDVDDVPLHVAALDHGLELAVVGGAVLYHLDPALLAERFGPGLFLRVLGRTAPADEAHALGCHRCCAVQRQEAGCKQRGCTFVEHHVYALIVVF
ncbi:hypothetical protein D9M71_540340 [compost metagenome]